MMVGTSTIKANGDVFFPLSEGRAKGSRKLKPQQLWNYLPSREVLAIHVLTKHLDVQTVVGGCGVVAQAARLQAGPFLVPVLPCVIKDAKLENPRTILW